jgi:predicted CXXCH cytochrome family protein
MPLFAGAAETDNCMSCHKKYFDDEVKKTFIHKPFLQKKCTFCHSPDWVDNAADSDGKAIIPIKTKILGSDENFSKSHLFSIPREYDLAVLFIEARTISSEQHRTKLKIDPFQSLDNLSSDAKPPEIFDVKVIEVDKGSMVSATIRWHTNELSDARLSFGIDQPGPDFLDCGQFLSDHSAELQNLTPDATYYFEITAVDIYGNTRESQIYSFSTAASFSLKEESHMDISPGPLKLTSEVLRSEDNYLVRISANQHVRIEISTYDLPNASMMMKKSVLLPQDHPILKSIFETNVLICETCHQALSEKFSHPVHFRARLGSNIPADYPRLPNGQVSCLTCHDYHASNYRYHLRKSAERELCIGCHKRSFRNR